MSETSLSDLVRNERRRVHAWPMNHHHYHLQLFLLLLSCPRQLIGLRFHSAQARLAWVGNPSQGSLEVISTSNRPPIGVLPLGHQSDAHSGTMTPDDRPHSANGHWRPAKGEIEIEARVIYVCVYVHVCMYVVPTRGRCCCCVHYGWQQLAMAFTDLLDGIVRDRCQAPSRQSPAVLYW